MIVLVKEDSGRSIEFILQINGHPIDLTGSKNKIRYRVATGPVNEVDLDIVTPNTDGKLRFTPTTDTFDQVGVLIYDILSTKNNLLTTYKGKGERIDIVPKLE